MTDSDKHVSEVKDVGDIWLTFCVMFALAVLATVAWLTTIMSIYWALLIAVPIGIAVGSIFSLIPNLSSVPTLIEEIQLVG